MKIENSLNSNVQFQTSLLRLNVFLWRLYSSVRIGYGTSNTKRLFLTLPLYRWYIDR